MNNTLCRDKGFSQGKKPICPQDYNCWAEYWVYKIGEDDYVNTYLIRSFRLSLQMEVDKHFDTSIQKEAIEPFKQLYPVESIRRELTNALEGLSKSVYSSGWKWRS